MKTRKLVIWDHAWAPWAGEFTSRLDSGWSMAVAAGGLEWLVREIADAAALVAIRLPAEALPAARRLEVFLYPGAGLLESDPARIPAGCPVANVYEHETPIAEYALMMMLAHVTRLRERLASFVEGRWDGSGRAGGEPHGELAGRTVGLIGYGRIGQAIAARARAFGMTVAAIDRAPIDGIGAAGLEDLARRSHFLVVAAPLTPETEGMVDARVLAQLPPGACLINVSRAEIVREQDLYDVLAGGRLAGAALDVWYRYPPPGEDGHGSRLPFHALPNVYCTPHYSAWSRGMIVRRIARMCENLNRLARGEPLERVVLTGTWRP